jgi:hypothetical protein
MACKLPQKARVLHLFIEVQLFLDLTVLFRFNDPLIPALLHMRHSSRSHVYFWPL